MKVFAISDLHLSITSNKPMDIFGPVWENYLEDIIKDWKTKVGKEDIVLIAGDISWAMHLKDASQDLKWISKLPGKKIIIRGNHDYWWKSIGSVRALLKEDMYAIQNDSLKIGNFIFCGTRGWTVPEHPALQKPEDKKIYDRELLRLEMSLKSARAQAKEGDSIFALIHYPPFNSKLEDSPFTLLFEKYQVKGVIYGHLHGKDVKVVLKHQKGDVTYYLTSCDIIENKLVQIV